METNETIGMGFVDSFRSWFGVSKSNHGQQLVEWLGSQLTFLHNFSVFYIIVALIFATVFLTEVLSNTALLISFLPIIGVIAIDMGLPVKIIGMAVVMSASCAFILPIATPPNAVILLQKKLR